MYTIKDTITILLIFDAMHKKHLHGLAADLSQFTNWLVVYLPLWKFISQLGW